MPEHPMPEDPPAPLSDNATDPIVVLLTRIEQHLARIARVVDSLESAPVSFQKELGPVRTMPEPLKR